MKAVCLAAALATAFSLPAEAKTLAEILKDKGSITEEELKEATKKSDLAYYEPGRGITVESKDGAYSASVGGRIQARYAYTDFDNADKEDDSSFSIRRLKLWWQGWVFTKDLKYNYQHNFGEGKSASEDAWLSYRFVDPLVVTLGQFKPPQARQELTSSGRQMFVDRSLANDTFNLYYDLGVQASGQMANSLVQYAAGVFNGNGANKVNKGNEVMFAARVDLNPLGPMSLDEVSWGEAKPLLNVGGSWAYEVLHEDDVGSNFDTGNDAFDVALNLDSLTAAQFATYFGDELAVWVATANVHFKFLGLSAAGECYWLNAEPDEGDTFKAHGYYVQAGYMVLPQKLDVNARYSAVDSDDTPSTGFPKKFDKSELQFGLGYYLAKHNAKIQADYTRVSDDVSDDADDTIYRIQAQVQF